MIDEKIMNEEMKLYEQDKHAEDCQRAFEQGKLTVWSSTTNTVKLALIGGEYRFLIDVAPCFYSESKRELFLRTVLSVLAKEETRIEVLTNEQAESELAVQVERTSCHRLEMRPNES